MGLGAARLLRDRAAELTEHEPVPSPCISVCTMNPDTGLCNGCYRTLDEIAAWSGLSDSDKRVLWQILVERVGPE